MMLLTPVYIWRKQMQLCITQNQNQVYSSDIVCNEVYSGNKLDANKTSPYLNLSV